MRKRKSLQERWDEEFLTDNSQFENCQQCKDCKFQSDGTIWSNYYTKASCQKYPYPKFKPIEIIDNKIDCCYRQVQDTNTQAFCGLREDMIMEAFSPKSLLALGDFYVYGLIDPRTDKLFYIGKGTGNRVFEHEKESFSNPDSDKLKLKTIAEIVADGLEVKKVIINSNLTENEAFTSEASLINIFNYISDIELTNIVAGHHSSEVLTVEEFERINGAEELREEDIRHNVVFIKITDSYRKNMTDDELYDVIRGVWKNKINKAQFAEYVLGVHDSFVVAVYKPTRWYKCKDALDKLPKHIDGLDSKIEERIFFVDEGYEIGTPIDENQRFYKYKSVACIQKVQSSINPFVYSPNFVENDGEN